MKLKGRVHRFEEWTDAVDVDQPDLGTVNMARVVLLDDRSDPEKPPTHNFEISVKGPAEDISGFVEGDAVSITISGKRKK